MSSDYTNNILGAFALTLVSNINEKIDEIGLRSATAATAIVTIFNHPDENIDILRRVLNLTHSGAVRLIDSLEEDGFLQRETNLSDKRTVALSLTKKGHAYAKRILQARQSVISNALNNLTNDQRKTLKPILETMLETLTSDKDTARRNCRLCNENVCRPKGCPVELASKE